MSDIRKLLRKSDSLRISHSPYHATCEGLSSAGSAHGEVRGGEERGAKLCLPRDRPRGDPGADGAGAGPGGAGPTLLFCVSLINMCSLYFFFKKNGKYFKLFSDNEVNTF